MKKTRLVLALGAAGLVTGFAYTAADAGDAWFDPVLQPGALCVPRAAGQPALLRSLVLAKAETAPFQPVPARPAMEQAPQLYKDLGRFDFPIQARDAKVRAWFNQGMVLAFGFNHAEAQRSFREAQKIDPACAMCYWGEALVLGPNINAPMMPETIAPANAAIEKAVMLSGTASAREQALIAALRQRYSADPMADRAALDGAYADAMGEVAARYPSDDTIKVLYAEAIMDTQPWDYWEAGGTKPKGQAGKAVAALEEVLARNPRHAGAAHLYIHAMEASSTPEKALPAARRLADLAPGAGHLVHMPAHIYYRLGMYRESLEINKRAIEVDERYFATSPSDPLYRTAYYPHNIHFVMVSAQMAGDGATALTAARKLDASIPVDVAQMFAIVQPVKAAPYTTHAQFADAAAILALPAPTEELLLVKAMYHYSRAVAFAMRGDVAGARPEIAALERLEREGDFKPFAEWQVPAKEVVQTARLVALGRLADSQGDLDAAAKAYEDAIFIEDTLAYMEPPYWYYPVRQSLGAVRLRQGRLDDAEKAFRDSLARVRSNGWALAGLAETYRLKGNAAAERATRQALAKAWLGPGAGPDPAKL
jgi:tetratricopeptide (TPR) repeat protein